MAKHYSVLLNESIDILSIKPDGIYLDLTLGRGGHSKEILSRIPNGHLYCFDLDEQAIIESKERLEEVGDNFTLVHENFANASSYLRDNGIDKVDGILMDLGVSSPQFDEGDRGFSYRIDSELDMRMDQNNPLSAKKIVNTYSCSELTKIFREYGEDRYAYEVASLITKERMKGEIATTGQLVDIIKRAKPAKELSKKGHPAKQIFQALRIETNGELLNLRRALDELPVYLNEGGVMAIISFHSLEDRMVKERFRSLTRSNYSRLAPESLFEERKIEFVDLTNKPIEAKEGELSENNRSHSAKLRAIRKKAKNER